MAAISALDWPWATSRTTPSSRSLRRPAASAAAAPGAGPPQGLAAVGGLSGDGQIRLGFEQHPQALPDEVLVVGDQDADHDRTRDDRSSPSGSRARTAELERVADYLVLMSRGRVQMAGELNDLLATHGQASLEELALHYLRDNQTEVAK